MHWDAPYARKNSASSVLVLIIKYAEMPTQIFRKKKKTERIF